MPVGFIYNIAEDLYRSYTCMDWRRYVANRELLQQYLDRLDRLAAHEMKKKNMNIDLTPKISTKTHPCVARPPVNVGHTL